MIDFIVIDFANVIVEVVCPGLYIAGIGTGFVLHSVIASDRPAAARSVGDRPVHPAAGDVDWREEIWAPAVDLGDLKWARGPRRRPTESGPAAGD